MHSFVLSLLVASLISSALGSPVFDSSIERRDFPILTGLLHTAEDLTYFTRGVTQELALLEASLQDVVDGKTDPVQTLEEALSSLSSTPNASDHNIIQIAIDIVSKGLVPANIFDIIHGITAQDINSVHNHNPTDPDTPIFPQKGPEDAPYDVPEDDLRSAIYIPQDFEYGANGKQPVLLVPGTAVPAGSSYYFSYEKLLAGTDFADPVWVNIPGDSLGDVQTNAEYVAYAINYISGVSNNSKIGAVSWSQGGLDVQWALKYWPSTREILEDFMAISADFHGTLFELPCIVPSPLCTPAIKQQGSESNFIHTLRADGGDSAYVPTTSVYSGIDEVVQPESDPNASATLHDARNVGVTNTQIQLACPEKPAGSFCLHETMLVNPISYALFVDALTHDGPGNLSRIGLDTVCNQLVPPGLGLEDLLGTEAMALVLIVVDLLSYGYTGNTEPPVKPYAQS